MRLSTVLRTVLPNEGAGITPQTGLPPSWAYSPAVSGRAKVGSKHPRRKGTVWETDNIVR